MKRQWIEDDGIEVGLDEAGRGSLWGRLYVGAVIMSPEDEAYFDNGATLAKITDSKKLTPRRRAVLADFIQENAIEAVVEWSEPDEIDTLNILQADIAAMHRALRHMETSFQRILVDGTYWKPWYNAEGELIPALTLTKGDSRSLPIAAASIIAKEAHDEWVRDEVARRPELDERYGFSSNVGYGAPVHLAGLKEWGADVLHRKSFAPVCGVSKKMTKPLFRT